MSVVFAALAVFASFVAAEEASAVLSEQDAAAFVSSGVQKNAEAAQRVRGMSQDEIAAALTEALSGKTKLIYQEGHGVFVEYTAPDGRLRMWYPNNTRVVLGTWDVRKVRSETRACFRYKDAVNPLTQVYEPTECVSAAQTLSGAVTLKAWSGDVFSLMTGVLPYRKGPMDLPSPPAAAGSPATED